MISILSAHYRFEKLREIIFSENFSKIGRYGTEWRSNRKDNYYSLLFENNKSRCVKINRAVNADERDTRAYLSESINIFIFNTADWFHRST